MELEGNSDPGGFAWQVRLRTLRVVGQADLPQPQDCSFGQLASGAEDGQWIRVRGVVHVAVARKVAGAFVGPFVELAMNGDNRLAVWVDNYSGEEVNSLVDSEAAITGICNPVRNQKRQLAGLSMVVNSLADIKIEKPAAKDPFSAPPQPLDSLLRFTPGVSQFIVSKFKASPPINSPRLRSSSKTAPEEPGSRPIKAAVAIGD